MNWTKCEDGLPEKYGAYIVTQDIYAIVADRGQKPKDREVDIAVFSDGRWCRPKWCKVIAWMEFPEPYIEPKVYCDRDLCLVNEYNGVSCKDCPAGKTDD